LPEYAPAVGCPGVGGGELSLEGEIELNYIGWPLDHGWENGVTSCHVIRWIKIRPPPSIYLDQLCSFVIANKKKLCTFDLIMLILRWVW
jgi:hypothetical protein